LGSGRVLAVALELRNDHNLSVDVFLAFGDVPFGLRQLSLQVCTALCVHAPKVTRGSTPERQIVSRERHVREKFYGRREKRCFARAACPALFTWPWDEYRPIPRSRSMRNVMESSIRNRVRPGLPSWACGRSERARGGARPGHCHDTAARDRSLA